MTLTFDLLISESMPAEVLPYSTCVQSLVLIARLVFLERGHTRGTGTLTRTPLITQPRIGYVAGMHDKIDFINRQGTMCGVVV